MCKFADANARGWNVLAGALCQWVEDAPHAVSVKWHQLLQQERLASDWEISGLLRGSMFFRTSDSSRDANSWVQDGPRLPTRELSTEDLEGMARETDSCI